MVVWQLFQILLPLLLLEFSLAFRFCSDDEVQREITQKEIDSLIASVESSKTGSKRNADEHTIAGCKFEKKEDGSYGPSSGCNEISINDYLKEKFGKRFDLESITSLLNGKNFEVNSYNDDGEEVTVQCTIKGAFDIIGGTLSIGGIFTIQLPKNDEITFQNIAITIKGYSHLGLNAFNIDTTIEKKKKSKVFEIVSMDFKADNINLNTIVKKMTPNSESMTLIDVENFKSAELMNQPLPHLNATGAFNSKTDFHIEIFTTAKVGVAEKISFILSRTNESPTIGAIMVKFSASESLVGTLNNYLNVKGLTEIKLLKEISSDGWCFLAASRNLKLLENEKVEKAVSGCIPGFDTEILGGLHVNVNINFKKAVTTLCGGKEDERLPEKISISASITKSGIKFSMPVGIESPLKAIITCLSGHLDKLPGFLTSDIVVANYFEMDFFTKSMNVSLNVTLPEKYSKIPDTDIKFGMMEITAETHLEPKAESRKREAKPEEVRETTLKFTTTFNVSGSVFDVLIEKKGAWTLRIGSTKIGISKMIENFKLGPGKEEFNIDKFKDAEKVEEAEQAKALGAVANNVPDEEIAIVDFSMEWVLEKGEQNFRIKGNPLIYGYSGAHLEAVYSKSSGKKNLAFGIYFNGVDFDWLARKIVGRTSISISWLSELKAVVVLSSGDATIGGKAEEEPAEDTNEEEISDEEVTSDDDTVPATDAENPATPFISGNWHSRERRFAVIDGSEGRNMRHNANKRSGKGVKDLPYQPIKNARRSLKAAVMQNPHHARSYNIGSNNINSLQMRSEGTGKSERDSDESTEAEEAKPKLEFSIPSFKEIAIKKGLTFAFLWKLPKEKAGCNNNSLCIFMYDKFGQDFNVTIDGHVTGSSFELTAQAYLMVVLTENKELKTNLTFDTFKLVVKVGKAETLFKIETQLTYTDKSIAPKPLVFTGSFQVTPSGLSLTFSMEGRVYLGLPNLPDTAEGYKYLALSDLHLQLGYTFGGAVPFPSIELGAQIILGKLKGGESNKDAVRMTGYFGFNPNDVTQTWFYAKTNKLNIEGFCKAYKLSCDNIPKVAQETGFPEGLETSYSLQGRKIEALEDLDVPAGFMFKGKVNFFGLLCWCECTINQGLVNITIEMAPLIMANGMIKITRAENNDAEGPMAEIVFGKGEFKVKIQGYASALGTMSSAVLIEVDNTHFKFDLRGTLIPGLLNASVFFQATYAKASKMSFMFNATITSDISKNLKDSVKSFITDVGEKAKGLLNKANASIDFAQAQLEAKIQEVANWNQTIKQWRDRLTAAKARLDVEANKAPDCSKECPDVCFGFLGWNKHCWKAFGYWVGCAKWMPCYSKIPDLICRAACLIKKAVSAVVRMAKKLALTIGEALATGANAMLSLGVGVMELAKGVLDVARDVLKDIAVGLQGALEAAKKLVDYGMDKLFNLEHLSIGASLNSKYSGCVGFKLKCTLFAKVIDYEGKACFGSKFSDSLAADISGKEFKGIENSKQQMENITRNNETLADAEKKLTEGEKEADTAIRKETTEEFKKIADTSTGKARDTFPTAEELQQLYNKFPKRQTVPTKEEMEWLNAAKSPDISYNLKEDSDFHPYEKEAPWVIAERYNIAGLHETVHEDSTTTGNKRQLNFESDLGPCEKMKRALSGYTDLTNGIIKSSEHMQKGLLAQRTRKNLDDANIRKLRSKIETLEKQHNLTAEQKSDAYLLYHKLAEGFKKYQQQADPVLRKQDSSSLPIMRRQLNMLLKKENGMTFLQFTNMMHENAVQGYKRSSVPHPEDIDGEKLLHSINKGLQFIITNEDVPLTGMSPQLNAVRRDIISMSEYTKHCHDR